jgi:hypothetical protein
MGAAAAAASAPGTVQHRGRDGGFYPRLSPGGNASVAAGIPTPVSGDKQGKQGSPGATQTGHT